MNTPHKHAEILRAIAEGKEVECHDHYANWELMEDGDAVNPISYPERQWRIKPEKIGVWVNVYEKTDPRVYKSKEDADDFSRTRIACKYIEITPGEGL